MIGEARPFPILHHHSAEETEADPASSVTESLEHSAFNQESLIVPRTRKMSGWMRMADNQVNTETSSRWGLMEIIKQTHKKCFTDQVQACLDSEQPLRTSQGGENRKRQHNQMLCSSEENQSIWITNTWPWERKHVTSALDRSWQVLKHTNVYLLYDPARTLGHLLWRN